MPRIRRLSAEEHEKLSRHWWRGAFVVAALVVAFFFTDEGRVGLFGAIPLLFWCAGPVRSRRNGVVVGLILLALLMWFTVPRWAGWSGRWVPSVDEVFWLHTLLATLVYGFGSPSTRKLSGFLPLVGLLPAGILITLVGLVERTQFGTVTDEGVLPVPAGLEVVEDEIECGSGSCVRRARVVGDNATEVMGAHLMDMGFTPVSRNGMCWPTGVVVTRETCVGMSSTSADSVRVSWYVQ